MSTGQLVANAIAVKELLSPALRDACVLVGDRLECRSSRLSDVAEWRHDAMKELLAKGCDVVPIGSGIIITEVDRNGRIRAELEAVADFEVHTIEGRRVRRIRRTGPARFRVNGKGRFTIDDFIALTRRPT